MDIRPPRWVATSVAALALVVALAGCTGAEAAAPASSPAAPTSAAPAVSSAAVSTEGITDAASCEAFGDVMTIVQNARVALHENRMIEQEFQGWMRLATRELDRVPTRGEGDVSESIAKLKAQAPPIPAGQSGNTPLADDMFGADVPLAAACEAAGSMLVVNAFTGG